MLQIAHSYPIPQPNPQIFHDLKAGLDLPPMSTAEAYFYVKAHKLVARADFNQYWQSGRDKQLLGDILADHYPPLEYDHDQAKGYVGLDTYVDLAKEVFNESTI